MDIAGTWAFSTQNEHIGRYLSINQIKLYLIGVFLR